MECTIFQLLFVLLFCSLSKFGAGCRDEERDALLSFRRNADDKDDVLSGWTEGGGGDCCKWRGVGCDNRTGHVIKLSIGSMLNYSKSSGCSLSYRSHVDDPLSALIHLQYLDLSKTCYNSSGMPRFLGSLTSLRYLNLSNSDFAGTIPPYFGNLTDLWYLDLSNSNNLHADNLQWLSHFSSLRYLDMSDVDLTNASDWLLVFKRLPALSVLRLSGCGLQVFPSAFNVPQTNLSSISTLDLSNNFGTTANDFDALFNLSSSLVNLDLSSCNMYGPFPLGNLLSVKSLDLSQNNLNGSIPENLGRLSLLEELDLSSNYLQGSIPTTLGNLTNLRSLNLAANSLHAVTLQWLSHLRSLQYLDMSGVNLTNATDWLVVFRVLPTLLRLDLSQCGLQNFPSTSSVPHINLPTIAELYMHDNPFVDATGLDWLQNLGGSLVTLDLHTCNIQAAIPSALGNFSSLQNIDLRHNFLQGSIPQTFGNLKNLYVLYLSDNKLSGSIPTSIGMMRSLVSLTLDNNNLSGSIPPSLGQLSELTYLDLSRNSLEGGSIPQTFGNLKNLNILDLSYNKLSGSIPTSIGMMRSLTSLTLNSNNLSGSIPLSLGQLSELTYLDLRTNALEGIVSELHFARLTKLVSLFLSSNHLVYNISSKWVPTFRLVQVDLRSGKLGPQFPPWLPRMISDQSSYLDVSDAGLSGEVPDWLWNAASKAIYLNISHNQLSGDISNKLISVEAIVIDLSWNRFQGQLPRLNPRISYLLLNDNLFSGDLQPAINEEWRLLSIVIFSSNRLTGRIPSSICKLESLSVLDVSFNNLSGEIPDCKPGSLGSLQVVNLASNGLSGLVPQWMGYLSTLQLLHLANNSFGGDFPSLTMCKQMVILNLGDNEFTGNIPAWVGSDLQFLRFLSLRSNKLNGIIPPQLSYAASLQLLDLSHNDLSGPIPRSFNNFSAMASQNPLPYSIFSSTKLGDFQTNTFDSGSYFDAILSKTFEQTLDVVMKGRILKYTKTLDLVRLLDLSFNSLSGELPMELMDLVGLRSLNLSANQLIGNIPVKIDAMTELETLDLSRNHFSGEIPWSVTSLTSLSHLNLSYNNLSGRIPSGNQLQTLTDPSIYNGNPDLCGYPLPKNCSSDETKLPIGGKDNDDDLHTSDLYLGMGVGFVVGLWGVYAILLFRRSWRLAYFKFVNSVAKKITMCSARLAVRAPFSGRNTMAN